MRNKILYASISLMFILFSCREMNNKVIDSIRYIEVYQIPFDFTPQNPMEKKLLRKVEAYKINKREQLDSIKESLNSLVETNVSFIPNYYMLCDIYTENGRKIELSYNLMNIELEGTTYKDNPRLIALILDSTPHNYQFKLKD